MGSACGSEKYKVSLFDAVERGDVLAVRASKPKMLQKTGRFERVGATLPESKGIGGHFPEDRKVKKYMLPGHATSGKMLEYCTPLSMACARGHKEIVDFLLQSGADPNLLPTPTRKPKESKAYIDSTGGTNIQQWEDPLHFFYPTILSPLQAAVQNSHFEIAGLLLQSRADVEDIRRDSSCCQADEYDHRKQNKKPQDLVDESETSMLARICKNDPDLCVHFGLTDEARVQAARWLIDARADVNRRAKVKFTNGSGVDRSWMPRWEVDESVTPPEKYKETSALMLAIDNGSPGLVLALLQHKASVEKHAVDMARMCCVRSLAPPVAHPAPTQAVKKVYDMLLVFQSGPEVISSEAHRAQFRPKGMPESFGIAFVAALRHDFCEGNPTELDKSEVARFVQEGPGTKEEIAKWWNDSSASHVWCLWDKELISGSWTAETAWKPSEEELAELEEVAASGGAPPEVPQEELFTFWLSKIALDFRVELEYIAEARHSLLEKGMFTKDDEFVVTADFECLKNFSRFDFGRPCVVSKGAKGRVIKHDVLGSGYIAAHLDHARQGAHQGDCVFSPRQQGQYLKLLSGAGEGNSHPAGPAAGGNEQIHNDVTEWLKVRSGLAKDRCARFPSALETLWMLDSPVKQLESYAQGLLSELQNGGQNA
eukprot:gnl/MRDRNA2_/MRDRNA2_84524_c0_seq4.p1 gnl/MRDRNA2_/MRDRNA2_84524_c0~~gnl/MRDRNA2_/MRDRNA2_84524_c0_seq4.p1  ORF type:complete len:655 (+),score=87.77 gnl/MRDRNA2_/MRDRNA2_84524_c0_seq4:94-2058(+)